MCYCPECQSDTVSCADAEPGELGRRCASNPIVVLRNRLAVLHDRLAEAEVRGDNADSARAQAEAERDDARWDRDELRTKLKEAEARATRMEAALRGLLREAEDALDSVLGSSTLWTDAPTLRQCGAALRNIRAALGKEADGE